MKQLRSIILLIGTGVVGLGGLTGCGPDQAAGPQQSSTQLPPQGRPGQPSPGPTVVGTAHDMAAMTAVMPMGFVPYANHVLPLVSPDGRRVATQAGVTPLHETAVADPGAPVPQATRVEIYDLSFDSDVQQIESAAVYRQTLTVPALLGRACDHVGFLVELQNGDGSRWIGRASWDTGGVEWLVQDSQVNAFASLGPGRRQAWSRRAPDGGPWDLVVRGGDGREWTLATGDDWLFPTWSGRADGLFVMRLRNGVLEVVHVIASDPIAARQSMRSEVIASGATIDTAYNALVTQTTIAGGPTVVMEQFVFFHPRQGRTMAWQPSAPRRRTMHVFEPGSFTALMDGQHHALVTTERQLVRQSLLDPRSKVQVLGGLVIPRRTLNPEWPYIMLEPSPGQGRVGLTAVRVLLAERGQ